MEIQGGEMRIPRLVPLLALWNVTQLTLTLLHLSGVAWVVGVVGILTLSLGHRAVSLGHGVTEPC